MPKQASAARHAACVRIIGGKWRGRKLHFAKNTPVRPSMDSVRETVFNWLQFDMVGARCLDAFAGSGAFGMEALSRGAKKAVFIEKNVPLCQSLQENLTRFEAQGEACIMPYALSPSLTCEEGPFNVVFLDPPYGEGLLPMALAWLREPNRLADAAWVYVECEKHLDLQAVAGHAWTVVKHKKTKRLQYALLQVVPCVTDHELV